MNPAQYGRYGDSQLVHMRDDEVEALGLLAQATTGSGLTTNPQTNYPEAFKIPKWVLPVAAIAATVMTAGAAAPAAAGAIGSAGAGAGSAIGAGTGGLLAAEGASALGTAAATEGAIGAGGLLGGEQAAMLAAQNAGLEGATAATNSALSSNAGLFGNSRIAMEQAAAPVANMNTSAGMFDKLNYQTDGLLGKATDAYSKYSKPVNATMTAANTGMQLAKANEPPPIQPPPQRQVANLDLSSILDYSKTMQDYEAQEDMRRRAMMSQNSANIGRF